MISIISKHITTISLLITSVLLLPNLAHSGSVVDSDMDGVEDTLDAFPYNSAASLDADGDGFPDELYCGRTGFVNLSISTYQDRASSIIQSSDGKLVVAGSSYYTGSQDFTLLKFDDDGSLDTSFGEGAGFSTFDLGAASEKATSVIEDSHGNLVVAGYSKDFALMRYTSEGHLDTSFAGGSGYVTSAIGSGNDYAQQVIEDSNGNFVVAGYSYNGSGFDFVVVRYTQHGFLDTSFGGGDGVAITTIGSSALAFSITEASSGAYLVAGYTTIRDNFDFTLVRYNHDGSLDMSFGGGDGIVTTPIGSGHDFAQSMIVDSTGKIVLAGYSHNGSSFDFALARYTQDGSMDASFGDGGIVTTELGFVGDIAYAVIEDTQGNLVVAGYSDNDVALARYLSDGSLDTSFGGDGIVRSEKENLDNAYSLVEDSAGNYVTAGQSYNGSKYEIELQRYTSDGKIDNTFGELIPSCTEAGGLTLDPYLNDTDNDGVENEIEDLADDLTEKVLLTNEEGSDVNAVVAVQGSINSLFLLFMVLVFGLSTCKGRKLVSE